MAWSVAYPHPTEPDVFVRDHPQLGRRRYVHGRFELLVGTRRTRLYMAVRDGRGRMARSGSWQGLIDEGHLVVSCPRGRQSAWWRALRNVVDEYRSQHATKTGPRLTRRVVNLRPMQRRSTWSFHSLWAELAPSRRRAMPERTEAVIAGSGMATHRGTYADVELPVTVGICAALAHDLSSGDLVAACERQRADRAREILRDQASGTSVSSGLGQALHGCRRMSTPPRPRGFAAKRPA